MPRMDQSEGESQEGEFEVDRGQGETRGFCGGWKKEHIYSTMFEHCMTFYEFGV